MPNEVVLVDYGMGNLTSVRRALEVQGVSVLQSGTASDIETATHVVLPGVGAFGRCMAELKHRKLDEVIINYGQSGRPLLGICVGMQVLLDTGFEFGQHSGLGLISGTIEKIPSTTVEGLSHKIPHIGWSPITPAQVSWQRSPLMSTPDQSCFYFVHSYSASVHTPDHVLATTDYNGHRVVAAVADGNIFGLQFHPERSGPLGLRVLKEFLDLKQS